MCIALRVGLVMIPMIIPICPSYGQLPGPGVIEKVTRRAASDKMFLARVGPVDPAGVDAKTTYQVPELRLLRFKSVGTYCCFVWDSSHLRPTYLPSTDELALRTAIQAIGKAITQSGFKGSNLIVEQFSGLPYNDTGLSIAKASKFAQQAFKASVPDSDALGGYSDARGMIQVNAFTRLTNSGGESLVFRLRSAKNGGNLTTYLPAGLSEPRSRIPETLRYKLKKHRVEVPTRGQQISLNEAISKLRKQVDVDLLVDWRVS